MRVGEISGRLDALVQGLVTLSRLNALQLLADGDRSTKLEDAGRFAISIDLAAQVQEFATRHYQHRPSLVAWPSELHPERAGTLSNGEVDAKRLAIHIQGLTSHILLAVSSLEEATAVLMAAPLGPLMRQLRISLPHALDSPALTPTIVGKSSAPDGARKVLAGPTHVCTDPIFTPEYSLLDEHVPVFGGSLAETVRYLWTVCVGESMAAELCALSAVEYDGLPLEFYRDMGKQAWDEMRHAVGYLDVAVAMLPEVEGSLDRDDPLREALSTFRREGRGLPIPRELNLYETIVNCSLEERLILFQIQTEAPGASRKKTNLRSSLCKRYPDLALALEFDLRDEIAHARIGRTWLAHLLPRPEARKAAIANASLLRSVLLMTSFAHHGGGSLVGLLDRYLTPAAPASSAQFASSASAQRRAMT